MFYAAAFILGFALCDLCRTIREDKAKKLPNC